MLRKSTLFPSWVPFIEGQWELHGIQNRPRVRLISLYYVNDFKNQQIRVDVTYELSRPINRKQVAELVITFIKEANSMLENEGPSPTCTVH